MRCKNCDRTSCRHFQRAPKAWPGPGDPYQWAEHWREYSRDKTDCIDHTVDWRERALTAEAMADRVRAVCGVWRGRGTAVEFVLTALKVPQNDDL